MDKKITLLGIIIIILIIVAGSMSYILFFNQHHTKMGEISFNLPSGYYLGANNKIGDVTITNGSNDIYMAEYDGNNASTYVEGYVAESNKNGYNITISDFSIDNITIYKSTIMNNSANHYWFSYNNKVYSIYTWTETPNIDSLVFEITKSIEPIKEE